jgi:hypothetical protein
MIVEIPDRTEHFGLYSAKYEIADTCPRCGGPRGKPFKVYSYDGSRRMTGDGWMNPCGHVDKYSEVRKEGKIIQ